MSRWVGKTGTVRLDGEDRERLRQRRFVMDEFRCVDCGRYVNPAAPEWAPNRAHWAHIISLGAGGSDTLENTRTKCKECHIDKEHAYGPSLQKPCPRKVNP